MDGQCASISNFDQVADSYGIRGSASSRDLVRKPFMRKQDPKIKNQIWVRDRKRRIQSEYAQGKEFCFISASNSNEKLIKTARSNSSVLLSHVPQSSAHLIATSAQIAKNQKSRLASKRKMQQNIENDNILLCREKSFLIELEQLRFYRATTMKKVRELQLLIDTQNQKIHDLEKKIEKLTVFLKGEKDRNLALEQKISQQEKTILEQMATIQSLEKWQDRWEQKNSAETQEDIERILSDINKNMDEISIEEKIKEDCLQEQRLESIIADLQSRLKYQEIELTMMKKKKYDKEILELECEKYKNQTRALSTKLRSMEGKNFSKQKEALKVRMSDDYQISFDLSKDDCSC